MYGDEFKLASLDFMGSKAELEAKAQAALAAAGGSYAPPEKQEGADSSGSLRVTVNRAGAVIDVHVGRDWRDSLTPDRFAAALLTAYQEAASRAAQAEGLASLVRERAKSPAQLQREEELRSAQLQQELGSTPPQDDNAWLRATWEKIYEIDDRLHHLGRATETETQARVASPYGHLTATHRGGVVTGISGDTQRLASADPHQLRTEALAIFRAAQQEGK